MGGLLETYDNNNFFCEMTAAAQAAHPDIARFSHLLDHMSGQDLQARSDLAHRRFYNQGVTFTLYSGDNISTDRVLPFDVIPRIISAAEWDVIERGALQRVRALNLFLRDIYHEQRILKDGVVPAQMVLKNQHFQPCMQGFKVPSGVYVHICGIDLVRSEEGSFHVLEDNARTPSGVSYVLENRAMMLRYFTDLIHGMRVRSVGEYGQKLRQALSSVAPYTAEEGMTVLLSPGMYNSAYFEHVFLAQEMGVPLVQGDDLFVENGAVYAKTTDGKARVSVIYRRIDDDFLDPLAFRPDSLLGIPGLVEAYLSGSVTLANAIGTGVADDKAVYAYMPRIIRYYLSEDAILPNVETHICAEEEALAYTLDHLEELVVKPVGASGGYGLLIGSHATSAELEEFRAKLKADPANYISQPVLKLSVSPTLIDGRVAPRHVDLRPFVITGASSWVLPGGLTRVALKESSLVVNSSQGGGSKDTWVLEP